MRDGAADGQLPGRPFRIRMDPLVIARRLGEFIDPRLINGDLVTDAHFLAHMLFQILQCLDTKHGNTPHMTALCHHSSDI